MWWRKAGTRCSTAPPHRYVYFAYASAAGGLLLCLVLLMMLLTDKTSQLFTDYWLSM